MTWSAILTVIGMLAVLAGAYYTTKFISNKSTFTGKNQQIKIIERLFIAKDKQILLLEVGSSLFLVGVTNQGINLLGTLSPDDLKNSVDVQTGSPNKSNMDLFAKILRKTKNESEPF